MKLAIIAVFLLAIPSAAAAAGGIGISPASLEFETAPNAAAEKEFILFNPGDKEILFEINSHDYFSFFPQEGLITSNGNKKISTTVMIPDKFEPGTYESNIYINFKRGKNEKLALEIGTMLKAIVEVRKKETGSMLTGIALSMLVIILGLAAYLKFTLF